MDDKVLPLFLNSWNNKKKNRESRDSDADKKMKKFNGSTKSLPPRCLTGARHILTWAQS